MKEKNKKWKTIIKRMKMSAMVVTVVAAALQLGGCGVGSYQARWCKMCETVISARAVAATTAREFMVKRRETRTPSHSIPQLIYSHISFL